MTLYIPKQIISSVCLYSISIINYYVMVCSGVTKVGVTRCGNR